MMVGTGICGDGYDYIDITHPFLRKIPIAIPVFKEIYPGDDTKRLSRTASDLLAETLEFTGYFKILDRDAFLVDMQTVTSLAHVNFYNWTSIGAELLVTGGVLIQDNQVEMELRLYDTFKEKLLVGKRYKGSIKDQRKIVRRFCSEIIFFLTGDRGFFNSEIAFVSKNSGYKEIYVCEFDGYNPRRITHTKSITLSPAWSSDGKWLAYTSYAKGKPDLYLKNLKQKRGAVISKKGINITPAWVPNKFALAATLSFSGDPEIYLLTGTGKVINRLTRKKGIDLSPTWSPDAKHMAFVSKRSGTPQIYIKNISSGVVRRLTFQGRYNTQPSWSPKGDKVAYAGMGNGRNNIFVIGIDGQSPTQLTHDQGDNEAPSWSPDGSLIVFSSTREGPSRIYIMTAYGTDQRRLLALKGEQTEPDWSPRMVNN
ncbi:MAG: Tol-Pal system beta propeller repeat protein TolB [Deltaproteobacteria bacterium]|nr:Tol-Pal system beta propeller repeat protein TolB [Deltaproteobacteria bacterium]MBW1957985.1 Tol-Pal system beta propeller repeat protein TolB [Deltaproteobacteria bacterium]MBW2014469.1 Tol-Pal system beta propeller repeat protein TolB [Deltaproteobacteria bacterium]MBW2088927.1 Tol-Pal system beta propeller repeat protein TolB [Deltaproteobacteria bacterium]